MNKNAFLMWLVLITGHLIGQSPPMPVNDPDDIWNANPMLIDEEFPTGTVLPNNDWAARYPWGCDYPPHEIGLAQPYNLVVCDHAQANIYGDNSILEMYFQWSPGKYKIAPCNYEKKYTLGFIPAISTQYGKTYGYGFYEIRFKTAEGYPLWPGIWLMKGGSKAGTEDGCWYDEINILESTYDDGVQFSDNCPATSYTQGYHWRLFGSSNDNGTISKRIYMPPGQKHSDDFHTYGLEYMEDYLIFYRDGEITHYVINPYTHKFPKHKLDLIIDVGLNADATYFNPMDTSGYEESMLNLLTGEEYCNPNTCDDISGDCKPQYQTDFCPAELDYVKVYDINKEDCEIDEFIGSNADLSNYNSSVKKSLTFQGDIHTTVTINTANDWFFRAGYLLLDKNVLITNTPSVEGDVILHFNRCSTALEDGECEFE